jgi:LacI family transcriptional regulator
MHITLQDIARLANTSCSTVSRVLANKPGVTKDKRERILELAAKLGYQPDFRARSLVTQRSRAIGFVVSCLASLWYVDVLNRITRRFEALGYQMLIADSALDVELERRNFDTMLSHRVEALIVFPVADWFDSVSCDHLLQLKLRRFPMVVAGRIDNYGGMDFVFCDETEAGAQVARHLLSLGHRRFGFVGHAPGNRSNRDRLQGVMHALREAGIDPDGARGGSNPALRVSETDIRDLRPESFVDPVRKWLAGPAPPTALIAASSRHALDLYGPLSDWGIRVPQDISIAGFDDARWCEAVRPSLTVCFGSEQSMAHAIMETLSRRMENPALPPVSVPLEPDFIRRASTAPAPRLAAPKRRAALKGGA